MDPAFIKALNAARHIAKAPIAIKSGRRCETRNKAEKGRPQTAHT